jgi:hypothetical protein
MRRRRNRRSDEQRRHIFLLFVKAVVALAVFGVASYYAYEAGFRVAEGEAQSAQQALRQAEVRLKQAEAAADNDHLAQAETARKLAEMSSRYDQVKPSDDMRDLLDLIRSRMAAGVTPRRLALVIRSAEMPRGCQALPARRLMVRLLSAKVPQTGGPLRLDDQVTVSAEAPSAGDGRDGWFDPAAAIKVHLAAEGGRETDVSGVLPIDYALAVKGDEYHVTLSAASSKGWIDVVTERCHFR